MTAAGTQPGKPPYTTLLEEALDAWRYVREGVLDELANVPEERWRVAPAEGARTIEELARHILESGLMMAGELTRPDGDFSRQPYPAFLAEYAPDVASVTGKAALSARLREAHAEADARFRAVGELFMLQPIRRFDGLPGTRFAWLEHGIEHESYHRGQIALSARIQGIVPALTRLIYGS